MAVVTQEVVVAVPVEAFFAVVTDYASYPRFVPGIKACRVRPGGPPRDVEYELDLGVKRITYVLRHEEVRPTRVSWTLVKGEMMKVSNGSWELSDAGGRTRAVYSVDIQIAKPPLVPQALIDRVSDELTRVQLPKTLQAFKARAERR